MKNIKRVCHGMRDTKVYSSWYSMKSRCYNKNQLCYKNYGGRGITICEEWRNSFIAYYEFVSKLLNYGVDGYTLDRIDNNGNYEPSNVKYSTDSEQANNRRVFGVSQYKGVSWRKDCNKWVAYIKINGKRIHLGHFDNELKASEAHQKALFNNKNGIPIEVKKPKHSSKFKGVHWHKGAKKWHARIQIKGKQINLGLFTNELEASKVYKKALGEIVPL